MLTSLRWWGIPLLLLALIGLRAVPLHSHTSLSNLETTGDVLAQQIADLRGQEPLIVEPFAADVGRWSTGQTAATESFIDADRLLVRVAQGPRSEAVYSGLLLDDFLLEVDVQHVAGATDYTAVLLFRVRDVETLYAFQVRSTGMFAVSTLAGGAPDFLMPPTASSAICGGPGARNRLGVLADGPQLTLLINDQVVQTLTDDAIRRGALGLGVSVFGRVGTEVAFDDLTVWTLRPTPPPAAGPAPAPPSRSAVAPSPTPVPSPLPMQPTATPEPTASPIPTATPTPAAPQPLEDLPLDWSGLEADFVISEMRLVQRTRPNSEATVLRVTLAVEAKADLGIFVYMANFYDAQGDYLNAMPVEFELAPGAFELTDMRGGWNRGAYGVAWFELPGSLARVESIRFARIF